MSRFDYVKYDDDAIKSQSKIKQIVEVLEGTIMGVGAMSTIKSMKSDNGDQIAIVGRLIESKKNALRALEEFYMWSGKAIRDDQIYRNGSAPLQEERNNE